MFILGFICGVASIVISTLLILTYTSRKQSKELLKHNKIIKGVDKDEIKKIIEDKRSWVTKPNNFGIGSHINLIKKNSTELISEIAKKHSPDAKYPVYELTLEEALLLNIHISERILKNLENKKLDIFKKLKLSKILELNDFKEKVNNNSFLSKGINILSKGWMVINIANPHYWIKKVLFNGTLEIASRTLGSIVISSIGSETYNVYSRKFKDKCEESSPLTIKQ